ncbi:MAG: pilus assembly protein PilM, partial [Spirochaetes bacterium]|nr:pilus assembly protein PilM [Spirochaetota bacterium]
TPEGRIDLSLEDAEAIKTEYGIIEDDSKEVIREKIPASQLSAMMRPFVERLLREVSHSINHFRRQLDAKVGNIYLYGGAARIKRLDEILKQNLEAEVSKFDPFQKMIVQLPEKQKEVFENFRLDFVVAAGLALGQERKFNILPTQIKVLHKLTTVRTGIVVGLLCFAITLLFFYLAVNAERKEIPGFH